MPFRARPTQHFHTLCPMKRILLLLAFSFLVVSCDYLEALNPEPQMTFSIDLSKSVTVEAEGGKISIPLE
jgi:hypothetical protein